MESYPCSASMSSSRLKSWFLVSFRLRHFLTSCRDQTCRTQRIKSDLQFQPSTARRDRQESSFLFSIFLLNCRNIWLNLLWGPKNKPSTWSGRSWLGGLSIITLMMLAPVVDLLSPQTKKNCPRWQARVSCGYRLFAPNHNIFELHSTVSPSAIAQLFTTFSKM